MPRRKISEYRAKQIVTHAWEVSYTGWAINAGSPLNLDEIPEGDYVVKVDQAVKGRFKKGLVALHVSKYDLQGQIDNLKNKGFESFLIEPYFDHQSHDERYLSLARDITGLHLSVSTQGGVDIESQADSIETITINDATDWGQVATKTGIEQSYLQKLVAVFERNYFAFLEINPYVLGNGAPALLDLAVEVDDAGAFAATGWKTDDIRNPPRELSDEERTVAKLAETSPASFMLQVINPDGAVFLLLSGGGASVVVADEVYSAGRGNELADYGEYSGNPTAEETYIYAGAVIRLLLRSKAPRKVLFIGGAVANFTNIEKTFDGIIRVIDEYADQLREQNVKVFVRRGGPHQEAGLANMRRTLEKYDLLGDVYDQTTAIGDAISTALKEIE